LSGLVFLKERLTIPLTSAFFAELAKKLTQPKQRILVLVKKSGISIPESLPPSSAESPKDD
jgi:hypothetical protein